MLLEEYIDKGILFNQVLAASKRVPIVLDDGVIKIGDVECSNFLAFGEQGSCYTQDTLLKAIEASYGM